MSIFEKILRLRTAFLGAKKIYKYGGITYVNIACPSYDDILKDKNILITGGSSGIGLAIAQKCTLCGANVIITGRNEAKLKEAVASIGKKSHYLIWDIAKVAECKYMLDKCKAILNGTVDVLVNNAGIAPSKFWGDIDEEEWNKIYDINLKGNYFLTQQIAKVWKESSFDNYKKIINISSQGGFVGATYPYRMTKWDIRGLTEGLGKILIKDNIIVNGIAPGVVKTSMQEFSLNQGENLYTNQNPIKRICLPVEIAELAVFLISDACNFIIGQTIICDGGYTLK